ncbi:DUF3094 family protein [Endozoicomonas elysicola]|uniref:DUF3094 family protein n=1 Tax=Endozoicomonas elysicola TaxID=305900 RepID=UPI000363B0E3|nr:DUF3094 family protein [Endozoicomonas elysicola]
MSQDTATPITDQKHLAPDRQVNRLYPEDQERVNQYLKEGVNEAERPPFKPLRLMAWLAAVIVLLGVLSRLIGYFVIPS